MPAKVNWPSQCTIDAVVADLHQKPHRVYLAATGAGAGIQNMLWRPAGASQTLQGAVFPYDSVELEEFIGQELDTYCSPEAAIGLATAAFTKGMRNLDKHKYTLIPVIGLGLTAAVASNRPKRGDHRVHIAIKTLSWVWTISVTFEKGYLSRAEEGLFCDLLGLDAILWAAQAKRVPIPDGRLTSDELRPLCGGTRFVVPKLAGQKNASRKIGVRT